MNNAINTAWNLITALNESLKGPSPEIKYISIRLDEEESGFVYNKTNPSFPICIDLNGTNDANHFLTFINCSRPFLFDLKKNTHLRQEVLGFLSIYLPYALLPYFSDQHTKPFTITHFAQSLDGRIATRSLDSKWIGNEENLIHAHRMRALCDAILIGSQTLAKDNPQLNVRHVKGKDPIKIIVGGDNLVLSQYRAIDEKSIVFSQNHLGEDYPATTVKLNKYKGKYSPSQILNKLYEMDLVSIYIEGGSFTSSCFLTEGCIDQVQIHISPQIIGSGKTGYSFNGISKIGESFRFRSHRFIPIGDEIMFVGEC